MIATTPRSRLLLGSALGIAAAICFGSAQYLEKLIVTRYAPPLVAASFTLFFGMVIMGLVAPKDVPRIVKSPHKGLLFAALAGLAGSCGIMFNLLALGQAPLIIVSPITGLNPLFALLLIHLFLQKLEKVTWRILLGAILVVGGVTLITVGRNL